MLNILDTKIKLTPSKDALNLIAADGTVGYRSTITFAALLVCKIKLNPALSAHEKTLLQMNAKYPLKCVSLKTVSVPKGMLSLLLHYRVVIVFVYATASMGRIKPIHLIFKH